MKFSLQNKLLLPIMIVMIVFLGGGAVLISNIIEKYLEEQTADMLQGANIILAKNVANIFKHYVSSARAVATMAPVLWVAEFGPGGKPAPELSHKSAVEKLQHFLEGVHNCFPSFRQINYVDHKGEVLASSQPNVVHTNVQDMSFFQEAVQGHAAMSVPSQESMSKDKTIMIAVPVFNVAKHVSGVIYAVLPCDLFVKETIAGMKIGDTGYSYIVDGQTGLMLAHNIYDKVETMHMFDYQPWMQKIVPGKSGTKVDYKDSQGQRRMAVYYQDHLFKWIAVSCITTIELHDRATIFRNIILFLTLCSSIMIWVIITGVVRSVTDDVHRTNLYAQAVTEGNLETRLNVWRNDELGALGVALRKMVDSLKQMVKISIEQTKERQRHLNTMRDAMLMTLADLVESRDLNTGQHVRKTAAYVDLISRQLKRMGTFGTTMTQEFIDTLVRSAPLHDIGKIKVPDAILNKPGKLTPQEFAVMQNHAVVGGEIIGHIIELVPDTDYLLEAQAIATYHHEWWNGKGYPAGLEGEAIPLSARIMAVADVFDALVSKRAYKDGLSLDRAFAIIKEESGQHFDPRVVEAFFAAETEVVRVKQAFAGNEV
ncbi:MAG: HD domain-containing protein [Desulfovibrionaceae bacterium]|nr:HD domain-containing protein [Desulfovibrionaceae bacterium]